MQPRDDGWLKPASLTDDRRAIDAVNGEIAVTDLCQAELGLFYELIRMAQPLRADDL